MLDPANFNHIEFIYMRHRNNCHFHFGLRVSWKLCLNLSEAAKLSQTTLHKCPYKKMF